jgi:hypothetical protein
MSSMTNEELFILGIVVVLVWSAIILIFARPDLFLKCCYMGGCSRKQDAADLIINTTVGSRNNNDNFAHATMFTVPTATTGN